MREELRFLDLGQAKGDVAEDVDHPSAAVDVKIRSVG